MDTDRLCAIDDQPHPLDGRVNYLNAALLPSGHEFGGGYPHQTGAAQLHQPLPSNQVAFTELLRQSGYLTAAAGKWHLGEQARAKFDLVRDTPAPIPEGVPEHKRSRLKRESASGCTQWIPVLRERPEKQPFFLWLASIDPHRDYVEGTVAEAHTPADVTVPSYLPDTPSVRKDLALY